MQSLSARWSCTAAGGHWEPAVRACEQRATRTFGIPVDAPGGERNLLNEDHR